MNQLRINQLYLSIPLKNLKITEAYVLLIANLSNHIYMGTVSNKSYVCLFNYHRCSGIVAAITRTEQFMQPIKK